MRCSYLPSVIQFTYCMLASQLVRFQRLLAVSLLLMIWTEPQVLAQIGPQPGATDPMGKPSRYYLLRDDEFFAPGVLQETNGFFYDYTHFPDANLKLPSSVVHNGQGDQPDYTYDPQIWTARGRVTTPNYDQLVYARRTGSSVELLVLDRNTPKPAPSYFLHALAGRQAGFSDFIGLAVGDLDKLADSAGVYHDEVVTVWASPGSNNNLTVNVAVLDYTDPSTDSTKQPIAAVLTTASNPIDALLSTNIIPIDNVLGVAVGDFDGDGKDEIALAHLQDESTLWVTTFRYTNDGKGNRTLQEVNATSATNSASSPYIATISVQAGDFNGDGTDEVAVGGAVVIPSPLQSAGFVQIYQSDQHLKLAFVSTTNAFLEPLNPAQDA